MYSHAQSPFGLDLKTYILEATRTVRLGVSSMNFLIVSGTMVSFSQGDGTEIKPKQFSAFGSRTKPLPMVKHDV